MNFGLRTKLLTLTAGMLLLLGGVTLILFEKSIESQKQTLIDAYDSYAHSVADSIAAQFYERYGDVQAFIKNDALQVGDRQLITKAFDEYVKIYGIYDVILLVDLKGNFVASNTIDIAGKNINTKALSEKNYENEPWFKSVVSGKYTEDSTKGFVGTYVEDPHFDKIIESAYGQTTFANSFSTAVYNRNGQMVGVLTNRANFKWVESEFKNFYTVQKAKGHAATEVTMLSKNGLVLIDYDPFTNNGDLKFNHDPSVVLKLNLAEMKVTAAEALVAGKSGSGLAMHARKKIEQAVGYSRIQSDKFISELGWGVMVRTDANELFHTIHTAERTFYISFAVLFLLCLSGIAWFATSISKTLTNIAKELSAAGEQMASASHQLSSASQQVSSGATESASALEETVSSIEELSSMVKMNAENAKQAAALSANSSKSAQEGDVEIRRLIESMSAITTSSKKIEEIINVIDDIAFQTNLLALNAAVEAARAGEQGKGFAVVAEAVRNLAQRSAAAAKDITVLIKDSVEKTHVGSTVASSSATVLNQIVTSVKKVSDLNNEIAAASEEQSNGIIQISKAMNELDSSTQQNAAASEEVASTSEEVSSQANTLQKTVVALESVVLGQASDEAPRSTGATKTKGKDHGKKTNGKVIDFKSKMKPKSNGSNGHSKSVIPFDEDEAAAGKVGTTDGF